MNGRCIELSVTWSDEYLRYLFVHRVAIPLKPLRLKHILTKGTILETAESSLVAKMAAQLPKARPDI